MDREAKLHPLPLYHYIYLNKNIWVDKVQFLNETPNEEKINVISECSLLTAHSTLLASM